MSDSGTEGGDRFGSVPGYRRPTTGENPASTDAGAPKAANASDDKAGQSHRKASPDEVRQIIFSDQMADRLLLFVGRNPSPFAKTYAKMRATGRRFVFSWSWPAFFFTYAWYFYRKLWFAGLAFMVMPFMIATVAPAAGPAVLVSVPVMAAIFAKNFYLNRAFLVILRLEGQSTNPSDWARELPRIGGVSMVGLILGGLLWVVSTLAGLVVFAQQTGFGLPPPPPGVELPFDF